MRSTATTCTLTTDLDGYLTVESAAPNLIDDVGGFMFHVTLVDGFAEAVGTRVSPRVAGVLVEWLAYTLGERPDQPSALAAAAVPPVRCDPNRFGWNGPAGSMSVRFETPEDDGHFGITVANKMGTDQSSTIAREEIVRLREWLSAAAGSEYLDASRPAVAEDATDPVAAGRREALIALVVEYDVPNDAVLDTGELAPYISGATPIDAPWAAVTFEEGDEGRHIAQIHLGFASPEVVWAAKRYAAPTWMVNLDTGERRAPFATGQ
jgi:hypothetical protein